MLNFTCFERHCLKHKKCKHLPDWDGAIFLEKNAKRQTREVLEAAHIITRNTFNSRNVFYRNSLGMGILERSSVAAKLAVGRVTGVTLYKVLAGFCSDLIMKSVPFVFRLCSDQG